MISCFDDITGKYLIINCVFVFTNNLSVGGSIQKRSSCGTAEEESEKEEDEKDEGIRG